MTTIANALSELGITEWVLRGEPTTEAEFKEMFFKVTGADANGTAIEIKDHGIAWATVAAKRDELIAAQPMKELRAERNRKLAETDWTQTADAPVDQVAWQDYRQALRDIPQQAGFPTDITWPTKPE